MRRPEAEVQSVPQVAEGQASREDPSHGCPTESERACELSAHEVERLQEEIVGADLPIRDMFLQESNDAVEALEDITIKPTENFTSSPTQVGSTEKSPGSEDAIGEEVNSHDV